MDLGDCDISVRTWSCLKCAGITTTDELANATDDELIRVRNLGRRSFEEVIKLREELRK